METFKAGVCLGRSQFKEMYGLQPDDGQLQVEYYPKSEHTFRLIENRKAACNRIADWFVGRFASEALSNATQYVWPALKSGKWLVWSESASFEQKETKATEKEVH